MSLTKPSKHREGKTLEAPGPVKKCEGCDADNGIIYCGQCRFVYCAPCQKAHSRNAFTKDHQVQRISDISSSNIEAKMRSLHLGICPKHIGSAASYACLACTTVFCDDCKGSHAGHEIKPCVDDDKVVQKICRAQTQSLYDALSFLENGKECIIKRKVLNKSAKLSVQETVKLCIDTLTELGRHAEEEIDKSDKELEKSEKEVVDFMQKVDDKISKLTSVRNVNDVGVLLPEAAKTAAILDEYDVTKDLFSRFGATEKDISDILPNIGGVENLISAMGTLLELQTDTGTWQMSDVGPGTEYDYKAMNTLEKIKIKDTGTCFHKICDAVSENEIIVHGFGMENICLYNIEFGTMKNMKMNFCIWNMVKLSEYAYIITQMHTQDVHLVDEKMKITDTLKAPNSSPNLICYYSPNSVVYLTKEEKKKPVKVSIKLVNTAGSKFCNLQLIIEFEVPEYPQAMFVSAEDTLTVATKSHLYNVNLKDASHNFIIVNDLPSHISAETKSLYIDAKGYHIIGDYDGNLHVVDKAMGHHFTKTIKHKDPIWGLTMKGDILYATCGGYIHKFKIPRK